MAPAAPNVTGAAEPGRADRPGLCFTSDRGNGLDMHV